MLSPSASKLSSCMSNPQAVSEDYVFISDCLSMFAAGVSETHGRCRLARVRQTRFLAAICCTGSDASISFPILLRSEFLHVSAALRISPLERFSRLRWRQGDSTVCHDYVSSVTARFSLSKLKDIEKICAAYIFIIYYIYLYNIL